MDLFQIEHSIGNTPLAEIVCLVNGQIKKVYAKLEWYNLTGSIKDRVAYYILATAIKNGALKKGQKIVEVTSGNTGISFSALGSLLGYEVEIIMPDWMSIERKQIMQSYGAKLRLVSKEDGGFLRGIELSKEYENAFLPMQFENEFNVDAHYLTTSKEMVDCITKYNFDIQNFVAGVGTGGTLIGCAKRLKQNFDNIKIIALEPESSPTLKTGYKTGTHKIEGISDEFIPQIYDKNIVDDIVDVSNEEAIYFSQILANKLGLGVGISSGANFAGCLKQSGNSITVFADDSKKYLSTNLTKNLNYKPCFQFEFISLNIYK